VNVLGHCGECHTPRGIAGEMELSRSLTGFALGRVAAPDITPPGLASRGRMAAAGDECGSWNKKRWKML
jgi:mono/diheme cytochrome c family protein